MELELPQQEVDWSKHHLNGEDLQPEVVMKKFAMWDYVVENRLLDSEDEAVRDKAILLLEDDTIYEYAFFKNDDGKSFEYEPYQDLIGSCKYDFNYWNDPNRFVMFVASNQIGKTRLLLGRARKLLFTVKGENIVIITNNLELSKFILSELKSNLNQSAFSNSWRETIGETDNTMMLTVNLKIQGVLYTNRIILRPAGEGSLGYPVHHMFLDELDFHEDGKRLFWKVYYPRLNKTKGSCTVFSNPNPDISKANSILHELWKGDLFKRKFNFMFLDASWNTQEEYDVAKRNSPSHLFSSTHDGKWSDLSGSFFSDTEIIDMMQNEWKNHLFITDKPVYISLDLGKMRDNTVIGVGVTNKPVNTLDKYLDLEVRYTEKLPLKTDYDVIAKRIDEIKTFYEDNCAGVAVIAYDSTGQKVFGDFLKRLNISARGVDFSAKESKNQRENNKTLMYNNFKLMAENRKIKVVHTNDCQLQFRKLEVKETPNKALQIVEHKTGGDHDDFPDMCAIMIHVSVRPSSIPVTATRVNKVKPELKYEDVSSTPEDVERFEKANVLKSRRDFYKSKQMFKDFGGMM